LLLKIRTPKKD